VIIKQNLSK